MNYFAFGSNLDASQVTGRVVKHGEYKVFGKATLKKHILKFNKKSRDGSGKANIEADESHDVEGAVYDFNEDQFAAMDKAEPGYCRLEIKLVVAGTETAAITYVSKPDKIDNNLLPTCDYLGKIVSGARAFGLSDSYLKWLEKVPCRLSKELTQCCLAQIDKLHLCKGTAGGAGGEHHGGGI